MSELVSIILPTYNRAALLPAAVASAQAAGSLVEVVVVDDASSDDTPAVCAGLTGVTHIRQARNQGLAAARNTGIRAASGRFIAFLDDDDARIPGTIDRQLERLHQHPEAALVYARVSCTGSGQDWPPDCPQGDVFDRLLEFNFIPVTSVLARREALLTAGLFDENLREVEDWDLWLRIAATQSFAALTEAVAFYTEAGAETGQLSSDRVRMSLACAKVQARALRCARASRIPPAKRRALRKRLLHRHWFELTLTAAELLLASHSEKARTHLLAAFRLVPGLSLRHPTFRRLVLLAFGSANPKEVKALRKQLFADLAVFARETEQQDG